MNVALRSPLPALAAEPTAPDGWTEVSPGLRWRKDLAGMNYASVTTDVCSPEQGRRFYVHVSAYGRQTCPTPLPVPWQQAFELAARYIACAEGKRHGA